VRISCLRVFLCLNLVVLLRHAPCTDWSNGKGTGTADGWVKHSPMDDEEMLFEQVQMTAAATPGTTVWIYRCSVYAYPWYTSVRKLLDDPAYAPWFVNFNNKSGPLHNSKCDTNFKPPKCSNHFHMQEQSPGFPHGDGDCAAPGCDCGKAPCGAPLGARLPHCRSPSATLGVPRNVLGHQRMAKRGPLG
jgi:hypothetical protein